MSNRVGGNQSRGSGDTEPCEGCERATDQLGIEVFDDEDQLRPASAVGPGLKMGWRMHEVLPRMDGNRSRLPAQRQQSFDPQDLGAVPVEQHCQPDAEAAPVDRLLDNDREGPGLAVRNRAVRLADSPERAAASSQQRGHRPWPIRQPRYMSLP